MTKEDTERTSSPRHAQSTASYGTIHSEKDPKTNGTAPSHQQMKKGPYQD